MSDGLPPRQRLLVGLAAATRFGSGVTMGTALAVLVERAGGSPFAVSLLFPAYFLGLLVFAPAWGALADVTGRRRAVLVATGGLATLAILPLLVVEGVWPLIGARALYAVFAAGFAPVMLTVVSESGGATRRGRALGYFNSARAVGFTGGQLVAGTVLGLLAPDGIYLVVAGLSLASTVTVALVAGETTDRAPEGSATSGGPTARTSGGSTPSWRAVGSAVRGRLLPAAGDRAHFRRNGLGWLYVALALRNATVMGVMSLLPVYLTAALAFPDLAMGVVLATNPASQIGFMWLFGRAADARGRLPLVVGGMAGAGLFALMAAAAVLVGSFASRLAVTLAAAVVIGAAFSAMTTGALAFIGDVAPDGRESELMGLRSTAKGVGAVLGAPAVGALATVAGFSVAFAVASSLSIVAAVVAWHRLTEPDASPAATVSG